MSKQIKPKVIIPELMPNSSVVDQQLPTVNVHLAIANDFKTQFSQIEQHICNMVEGTVKKLAETSPETLAITKSITIVQPIEIRFGTPQLTIEMK